MNGKELKKQICDRSEVIFQWRQEINLLGKLLGNLKENVDLIEGQIDALDSCIDDLESCVSTDNELLKNLETYESNNKELEKIGLIKKLMKKVKSKSTKNIDKEDPRKLDLE
ncbi:hypothetical protein LCGC14_3089930 [marine sediment metagenome]|uniref:Uncharacterized protein n=1 Tax=marine sediment metagenome TaxID=412755 RepID=A0A0F8Z1D3_9ZZZZ